jgi:hypothetical protein
MMVAFRLKGCGTFTRPKMLLCGLVLMAAIETSLAALPISSVSPLGFFTNVASRLLASELNLDLTQIEIYPTNQYTPAVHRLLQVTANIYDATSTNYYPTIFRPLFSQDGSGNVFITGYTNVVPMVDPVTDSQLDLPVDAATVSGVNVLTNVYGVPWVIGAKKGFPNFNAFTLENVVGITRKLQMSRPSTNVYYWQNPSPYTISQQLTLGITNLLGVECWNSYQADYTNQITIYASDASTAVLTNDEGTMPAMPPGSGIIYTNFFYVANNPPLAVSDWPGYGVGTIPQQGSFIVPLAQYEPVLPDSIYTFNPSTPFVLPSPSFFVTNTLMPHWGLLITNRLRVLMAEYNAADGFYHVIDYVQLVGPDSSHDLTADIQHLYDTATQGGPDFNGYNDQWDTNSNNQGVPNGIANQIFVSGLYLPIILSPYWSQLSPIDVTNQTAGFRAFLGFSKLPGMPPSAAQYIAAGATSLAQQAPYTPMALVTYQTQWEANDPLVHYLASDLTDFNNSTAAIGTPNPVTFTVLNYRYWPWGGNPQFNSDPNPYNLALKDPLVYSSDEWNFPTGQPLNSNWLGQVHRGTPWQTIYLKATDLLASSGGLNIWTNLTGDPDAADATLMAPVRDWHLASLLSSLLDTNAPASLLSINNPDTNAWQILLNGLTALTSTLPGQFEAVVISSNSPQAAVIANAIQSTRATQPGQSFRDIGDVLATSQLAEQSPFLIGLNATNEITDEAYEMIPSQLLSLLRADSIGSVVLANGQTAIQFTGSDGHAYAIEVSPDLLNWTIISTNCSMGDIINFTNLPPLNGSAQFYRSVLLN